MSAWVAIAHLSDALPPPARLRALLRRRSALTLLQDYPLCEQDCMYVPAPYFNKDDLGKPSGPLCKGVCKICFCDTRIAFPNDDEVRTLL